MMSGPKCYQYHVDPAVLRAEREAARLAAEKARLGAALHRFQKERLAAIGEYGSDVGGVSEIGGPGDTADNHAAFESRLASARAQLRESVRSKQQARMLAALAVAIGGDGTAPAAVNSEDALARVLARVRTAQSVGPVRVEPDAVVAAVARNLARLPAGATPDERARIQADAEQLLAHADDVYAEARLDGLRAAVIAVERAATQRAHRQQEVEGALRRLAALDPLITEDVIRELERARGGNGPLPAGLTARVNETEALAERNQERAYVADVLARTLGEIGYEVGPGFETSLDGAGFADVAVPSWSGYGVRVRSAPAGERLTFNVVRGVGDVDPRRDAEVEHEWCSALPEIVNRLSRAGIEAERVAAVAAGAQPVQVDPSLPAISSKGQSQSRRARELPADGR